MMVLMTITVINHDWMELNVIMVSHSVELTPYVKTIGTQCFNAEVFNDDIATTLKDIFFSCY